MYKKIAKFFVENKQLSILLILTSFIVGLFAYTLTAKQYNPQITLPAFRIITEVPGADAQDVETLVTNEIENKLYEIPNVDETFSQTYSGGLSIVTVMFKIGEGEEEAKTKVYEKMYSNLDLKPIGVKDPIIKQVNPENVAIINLAISSNDYSAEGLRYFAFDLREEFKKIDGVTNIEVKGASSKKFMIELDAQRMQVKDINIQDIKNAVVANNLYSPLGYLEGETDFIPLELDAKLNIEELKKLSISFDPNKKVLLEEVAKVHEGYDEINEYTSFSTKDTSFENTVFLSLSKTKGENGVVVANKVKESLKNLEEDFVPEGIDINIVRDEGRTAQEAISGLVTNLLTAILIVTVILILFLRLRAALIVALAIPLTLSLVLLTGYLAGKTVNRITLFALILSLGLLVDSATVVVENIFRHLKKYFQNDKISKNDANKAEVIGEAVNEVGTGLLLSTITSVIVFLPMSFVTGMMGAYMGPIAFFVPVTLIASLIVAYTISPFLSSKLLKREMFEDKKEDKEFASAHTSSLAKVDARSKEPTSVSGWYEKRITNIISSSFKRKFLIFLTFLIVLITFSFPVLELIHFKMLPTADKEQFYIYLDAPENTSIDQTQRYVEDIEHFLLQDSEVRSIQTYTGTSMILDFNGLFKGADSRTNPYQSTIKVNLSHPDERKEKSEDIVVRIRPELKNLFNENPDLSIRFIEDPPGPPVLSTLILRVKGEDQETRENIAKDMVALFENTDRVVDIDATISSKTNRKIIKINQEKLSASGLSVAEILSTLRLAVTGEDIAIANLKTNEANTIFLRFSEKDRANIENISNLKIQNAAGQSVYLSSVTEIVDENLNPTIWHDEKEKVTYISAELSKRPVVYAVKDLIFDLFDYKLSSESGEITKFSLFGFTFLDKETGAEYKLEWGGEFEMTLENFRDLGMAMGVAFFFIYVVLVAQFRSFKTPIFIMTSIMLAFGGVLPGFAILDKLGIPFTATSMIGLIALGGIVVNNSIILMEFIQQLVSQGKKLKEAVIYAAKTRLRPIVLTSITTILGSLTIVSDPVWSGLAWAVVFGLTLSTVLTLLVFPVLYYEFSHKSLGGN